MRRGIGKRIIFLLFCLIAVMGLWAVGIATAAVPNPGHSWDDIECNVGDACVVEVPSVGLNGLNPEGGMPYGYGPGIHVKDVYSTSRIGVDYGGSAAFYMDSYGNAYFAQSIRIGPVIPNPKEKIDVMGNVKIQTENCYVNSKPSCSGPADKGKIITCYANSVCPSGGGLELCNGNNWICMENLDD